MGDIQYNPAIHDRVIDFDNIMPLPCKELAYVELWCCGYSLCIVLGQRQWYHSGSGERMLNQTLISQLEEELCIQHEEEECDR